MPEIFGLLVSGSIKFLFMTYFPGETLEKVWPILSPAQKLEVRDQLNPMLKALRNVPEPPLEEGQSALGGGTPRRCKDNRYMTRTAGKQITNEVEFNTFLTTNLLRRENSAIRMIRSFMRDDHRMVMTHGDLHPRNIIVTVKEASDLSNEGNHLPLSGVNHASINVCGILDWETCGWYPEYWEFVKALCTVSSNDPLWDWRDYLPASIGFWPAEYAFDLWITTWFV